MAQRWAVDMVEAMRRQNNNEAEGALQHATVSNASPLTISTHGQTISQHLFAPPELVLQPGDGVLVWQDGVDFYIIQKVVAV